MTRVTGGIIAGKYSPTAEPNKQQKKSILRLLKYWIGKASYIR